MRTRDPEPTEQLDPNTSSQPTLWSGWRGPLIGGLLAVIVVFAVLDISHVLFPQRAPNTTRPIVIQVQNGGGDTSAAIPSALAASPRSLSLSCGQSATIMLTNTASYSVHWTLDTIPDGITLSSNSPRGGGLAPGEHTTVQVVSLGKSISAALHFSEDRGSTLDVSVQAQC